MDMLSATEVARELGTSVPRVTRASERMGIDARRPNGRFAFTRSQADQLRRELGVMPQIESLTRSEAMALAALRSAPFGLVSARAVARRSGLSPTAAGHALSSLQSRNLVVRPSETIAAGRARKAEIWCANVLDPRWKELDPLLHRVEIPERPAAMVDQVPSYLRHLFWNTAESQLDVHRAGAYIARRLLQAMDLQGLAWGAQVLDPEAWRQGAKARGLDPKVKRLAHNLAEAGVAGAIHLHRRKRDASQLKQLAKPTIVTGLNVASMRDLMAMKIKVMAERGEMRDYFDVKAIDEDGAVSVEEGIELYIKRYDIDPNGDALLHLYRAMGDLSDVEVDELLPVTKAELQKWWSVRQVEVLRNSSRFG